MSERQDPALLPDGEWLYHERVREERDRLRALAERVTPEMLRGLLMYSRPHCREAWRLLRALHEEVNGG